MYCKVEGVCEVDSSGALVLDRLIIGTASDVGTAVVLALDVPVVVRFVTVGLLPRLELPFS